MNAKYRIDTEENKAFMRELTEELLSFGHKFPSPEGSAYYLGDDGTPWTERPRETWITCRMVHVYSIGAMLGHAGSGELADAALRGIRGELKDKENGGWYPGIRSDGAILPGKQCYAHAFVILAATSALLAKREGAKELLDEALALYDRQFWNEEEGLACDTWNTAFMECDPYRGLNANMHTVEAFLAVADAIGLEEYRVRAGRIIDRVLVWAEENEWRIPEHFTKEWEPDLACNQEKPDDPFKPYGATPGHGIEWARLITQWAISSDLTDVARGKYVSAAENLYQRAIDDAWNADGEPGLVYTTDWNGKPVVHDRMHWTLAEAINSAAVLYRVTGKACYAEDYAMFLSYLDEKVLDHKTGSWFHQMNEKNEVTYSVWPGKSDIYHALQATLIPYEPMGISIATAIHKRQAEFDVIALGELLIDFTENGVSTSGNPLLEANPGGAPCNALSMLQNLGHRTAFIGKVGKDSFGDYLEETILQVGIDATNLRRDEKIGTTLAFVHTAPDGDRSFSFYRNPGADMMLTKEEIDFSVFDRAKIFHFGTLSMTHPEVRTATMESVRLAKEKGLLISFDPNYRPLLWEDPGQAKEMMRYGFARCDILKISDDEITFVTGKDTVQEAITEFLTQYRPRLMCVTMGKEGSIAVYQVLQVGCKAILREDTIETTGAGDTFMAGILHYVLLHGLENLTEGMLFQMQRFAAAAASIITTRKGALKVMPTVEEVRKSLAEC